MAKKQRNKSKRSAKHRLKQQIKVVQTAPEINAEVSGPTSTMEKIDARLRKGELIPTNLKKIKTKWVRRAIGGVLGALIVLMGATYVQQQMQGNITGISAEYRSISGENETPYATELTKFMLDGKRSALFTYMDDNGMKFVLLDLTSKKVIMEDTLTTDKIEPNSVMALAQLLPSIIKDGGSNLKSIERVESGFKIDGKKYALSVDGIQVTKVNDNDFEPAPVYLVSESHKELTERNKIDESKLKFGFVEYEVATKTFVMAAIDKENGSIYTFRQEPEGLIKLTIQEVVQ